MDSIIKILKNNQLKSYFILTFLITWSIFFIPLIIPITDPAICILVMAIGGSGPAFAAIILSGLLKREFGNTQTQKQWAVFFIAFCITTTLILAYLKIIPATASLLLLLLVIINAGIAAYIISGGLSVREGIRELLGKLYVWNVGWKWYILALSFTPVVVMISIIGGSVISGISVNEIWSQISTGTIFSVITAFGYIALVRGPLREEIGWRGFALPRLQYLYSPLVGTLILGVIWTIWHLPLHLNGIYTGGMDGFIERFYVNIGITFVFTWIYNHSRGSLLLTTLFHASFNTTVTVLLIPSVIAEPYSFIFIIFINLAAVAVIFADKMWRKLPVDHEAVYEY